MTDTPYTERIEVRIDPETKALVKRAAHRKEQTVAEFIRETLRKAAEFYVGQA